jgi:hypothetical protein
MTLNQSAAEKRHPVARTPPFTAFAMPAPQ